MTGNDEYILEILESVGLINHAQSAQALEAARAAADSVGAGSAFGAGLLFTLAWAAPGTRAKRTGTG